MAITLDPANKRIILDSASVTAQALYAAWVDWVALSDNMKYLPAFSAVGGDDLGGGLSIPPYYFLLNGWRVRPMESSHNLTITGNLFVDGGGVPVVNTLGTFQVNVNYTVPVQAQGISTSGSTAPTSEQNADAVWAKALEDGETAANLFRIMVSALAGKVSVSGPTVTFRDLADTKDRIVAATDANGQRTAVTLDGA